MSLGLEQVSPCCKHTTEQGPWSSCFTRRGKAPSPTVWLWPVAGLGGGAGEHTQVKSFLECSTQTHQNKCFWCFSRDWKNFAPSTGLRIPSSPLIKNFTINKAQMCHFQDFLNWCIFSISVTHWFFWSSESQNHLNKAILLPTNWDLKVIYSMSFRKKRKKITRYDIHDANIKPEKML